ncbi:MAG: hypothetical protein K2I96_12730 [Lachnospiraceae bacterium]|nr:hypothetical protein [Lachnospiraceae bacterium]
MEENNKFETNTDSSGSGSILYGSESQQTEESGHFSVYGAESQQPVSASVPLAKPSEETSRTVTPVQLAKPTEPEQASQVPPPVFMQPGQFYQSGNGQPDQNPMGFGPMQVSPPVQGAPEAKPKKSKTGPVVGILCAAAVVIVIVIGILAVRSFLGGGDPRKQLARGIANMTKEMAAYQSSIAGDIGLAELNKLKETEPMHTNIDFSFTDPNAEGSFTNIDIGIDAVTDYRNKLAECDVSLGTYGIDMSIGSIVMAGNTMYLSVPLVFHDEVYSLDLTNLGRDFNNSAWSSLIGETLPEDYSLTLFGDRETAEDSENAEESEILSILNRQRSVTAETMKFEAIRQKREFTFGGTYAEYGGVRVTIDKDAYNESMEALKNDILASESYKAFMEGFQTSYAYADDFDAFKEEMDYVVEQLFGLRFEQDPVVDVYLDKKGRIVNISTPEDIAVSGQDIDMDSIAVDIDFSGTERTLDSIEGGIYVQSGDEILYMGISRAAAITEDYYSEDLTLRIQDNNSNDEITFWYANDWGYADHSFDLEMAVEVPGSGIKFGAEGAFTDIVKGEGYTFRLNRGRLTVDGEDMLLMTGSIETEPTDRTIEVPENATNVLDMSMSEIMSLFYGTFY